MVRTLGRLFAVVTMVLPLTTCIFVLSAFPSTLSQIVARADLAGTIPAGSGSAYRPFIVTPTAGAGGEFVILLNRDTSSDPAAVIMDSDLDVIQAYTVTQLAGWGISFGPLFLMTDATGNVAFRDHWFSPTELETVNLGPSGDTTALNDPSFSSLTAGKNDINFHVAGNDLTYSQHTAGWVADFFSGLLPVKSAGGNYRVEAVYNADDTPASGKVVIVLSDQNDSSNVTLVAIPLVNVLGNSVVAPLLSNYPHKSLTNVDSRSIGFAGDCIVVYSHDSHTFDRYSLATPFSLIDSLSVPQGGNHLQYAYKMTGDYSVIYDEEKRTLTKVANWW